MQGRSRRLWWTAGGCGCWSARTAAASRALTCALASSCARGPSRRSSTSTSSSCTRSEAHRLRAGRGLRLTLEVWVGASTPCLDTGVDEPRPRVRHGGHRGRERCDDVGHCEHAVRSGPGRARPRRADVVLEVPSGTARCFMRSEPGRVGGAWTPRPVLGRGHRGLNAGSEPLCLYSGGAIGA